MKYFRTLEQLISEKIHQLTRTLSTDLFLTPPRRKKINKELQKLLKERDTLIKTLGRLFDNEKQR